jgi:sec-independent protein translocase protein TatB
MFLGLGMFEIGVIALLALLIIGPKELPVMLRTLGNGWKQLMQLRREFMRTVNAFMRENDLDEVRNAAKAVQQFRPPSAAEFLDPDRSLRKDLADIDQEVKTATEPEPKTNTPPDASGGAQSPAPPPAGIGQGAATTAPSPASSSTPAAATRAKSADNRSASPTARPSKRPAATDTPNS